ncbi:hypothetical protein PCC7418_0356 [Halothece sp. PCC 7418]|uniref:hypothetical protein n=1 Tax=Halothece sp. (strain PCC 7418) TaxID=65093 RepID=UPI0002A06574|nr:hypothetical protein [Halothece sp. PCC 7418]AFZ42590.1 hypothetical protein PCC7418_0356 [Halothece sp. PCC 7418]
MKSLLTGAICTLVLVTTASSAMAEEVAVNEITSASPEIQPFNLVHRAYSGHFSAEGIPGFQGLVMAYRAGQVEAEDLMEVAIQQGRLSPDALEDQGYVNAVRFQLRGLERDTLRRGNRL